MFEGTIGGAIADHPFECDFEGNCLAVAGNWLLAEIQPNFAGYYNGFGGSFTPAQIEGVNVTGVYVSGNVPGTIVVDMQTAQLNGYTTCVLTIPGSPDGSYTLTFATGLYQSSVGALALYAYLAPLIGTSIVATLQFS